MAKKKAAETASYVEAESAWTLPEDEIDRMLASGLDPRLSELFGSDLTELRQLARQAAATETRGSKPTVVFLPGILGSSLGKPRSIIGMDTIWFDPVSLARGKVKDLRLAGSSSIRSLGVLPIAHTFIRLRLKVGGFRVKSFHYDWRQSIPKLGSVLVDYINELRTDNVMLVAHSMGGLVSRAALHIGCDKIRRVVMLGTPNRGSFSPLQVFAGENSTLQSVDKIDIFNTSDELIDSVFSTFPSLYEMLPRPEVFNSIDLFKSSNWPKEPHRPSAARLRSAIRAWDELAEVDDRLHLIAGVDQETAISAMLTDEDKFEFTTSHDGDGTVPRVMCELEGVPTRYVAKTHLGLLQSETVAKAMIQLLNKGETKLLLDKPPQRRTTSTRVLVPSDFDSAPFKGRRGQALTRRETALLSQAALSFSSLPLREVVEQLSNGQPGVGQLANETVGGGGISDVRLQETLISRDVQTQFDVELCHGSLFSVPYRAIVLGVFQDVDPAGPALHLDKLMNGAVNEMIQRRMFQGAAGKVFVMPTGRNMLKAEHVVFMGLGNYADFVSEPASVLKLASANTLRTLLHCGVDEFATVIYGGATGFPVREAVKNMVGGYLEAAQSLRSDENSVTFRRLGLCEIDDEKYAETKSEVTRFAFTEDSRDIRMRLHEPQYPQIEFKLQPRQLPSPASLSAPSEAEIVRNISYLSVRVEEVEEHADQWLVESTLMTSGGTAAVFPSAKRVSREELDDVIKELPRMRIDDLEGVSDALKSLVFSEDFTALIEQDLLGNDHLAVIHNALATRIPWEVLSFGQDKLPCLQGGLSRRHEADQNEAIAKHVRQRQTSKTLKILLVVDPTKDLPGAEEEGARIRQIAGGVGSTSIKELVHDDATRETILRMLASGEFDILHYAGHAFFDPLNRRRSGLVCADSEVLRGEDIAKLNKLPSLVFFNACESGRVRGIRGPIEDATLADKRQQNIGIAETLLNAGVTQFVGTYWPVGDAPAKSFAEEFYSTIVQCQPIYQAVLKGRQAVHQLDSIDFADYMHYGSPTFQVKKCSS